MKCGYYGHTKTTVDKSLRGDQSEQQNDICFNLEAHVHAKILV